MLDELSPLRNPYALRNRSNSGDVILPEESDSKVDYYCPECEGILRLRRSKEDRPHFFHLNSNDHEYQPETLLHILAIKNIVELDEFELPPVNICDTANTIRLDKSKTEAEFNWYRNKRPDVKLVTTEGKEYLIEVYVTHETRGEKLKLYIDKEKQTIEIDLSDFYREHQEKCKSDVEFVRNEIPDLVGDINRKKWLSNIESDDNSGAEVFFGTIVAFIVAGVLYKNVPWFRKLVNTVFNIKG